VTGGMLPLSCQVGDCRNRAALTVTLELPTDWSASREYTVRTLQVAVCGDCAPELEACGRALLEGRVQYARRMELEEGKLGLAEQLVGLIEAIGPPFEPVQGGTFATWLAKLDKPRAQAAWRVLAVVKRKATEGRRPRSDSSAAHERRDRTTARPLSIESARFRRQIVVPPIDPGPPSAPRPPAGSSPRGGDDAA
jgi:hypothetical protein